jgi:sucrose phosphorylase
MAIKNKVQLITYPDSIGKNLKELKIFLDKIENSISGVHILPPYPSNNDRGFSPISHKKIDPKFGTWSNIKQISNKYDLCLDITLNHISDESKEFQDVLKKGSKSKCYEMFIDIKNLGEITKSDLEKIHIRKEKEPFIKFKTIEGNKSFWCTFTKNQIDLNYNSKITYEYISETIKFLAKNNVKLFRLDAFGYITKKIGTTCFLLEPETYKILRWFQKEAKRYKVEILPEVHDHPSYQIAISKEKMYSYSFALSPLILYTLLETDTHFLKNYLRAIPTPSINILDTHDGICIPDVEGYLPEKKIKRLIDKVEKRGSQSIKRKAINTIHSVGAIYQLTCTYYDALNKDNFLYLCSRAIQLFTPGVPQIYYVGLFAGENKFDRVKKYKNPREINREQYSLKESIDNLNKPIVKDILTLMELRNNHDSFQGEFNLHTTDSNSLKLSWEKGKIKSILDIDLKSRELNIYYTNKKGELININFEK